MKLDVSELDINVLIEILDEALEEGKEVLQAHETDKLPETADEFLAPIGQQRAKLDRLTDIRARLTSL